MIHVQPNYLPNLSICEQKKTHVVGSTANTAPMECFARSSADFYVGFQKQIVLVVPRKHIFLRYLPIFNSECSELCRMTARDGRACWFTAEIGNWYAHRKVADNLSILSRSLLDLHGGVPDLYLPVHNGNYTKWLGFGHEFTSALLQVFVFDKNDVANSMQVYRTSLVVRTR